MSAYAFFLTLVLLILISAFFSISEIALTASKRTKLQVLSEKGEQRALKIMLLKEQPGNFFTVVQIGVNAVAILGGVLSEGALNGYLRDAVLPFVAPAAAERVGSIGSFLIITVLFIQFADLIPKRLAMINP